MFTCSHQARSYSLFTKQCVCRFFTKHIKTKLPAMISVNELILNKRGHVIRKWQVFAQEWPTCWACVLDAGFFSLTFHTDHTNYFKLFSTKIWFYTREINIWDWWGCRRPKKTDTSYHWIVFEFVDKVSRISNSLAWRYFTWVKNNTSCNTV